MEDTEKTKQQNNKLWVLLFLFNDFLIFLLLLFLYFGNNKSQIIYIQNCCPCNSQVSRCCRDTVRTVTYPIMPSKKTKTKIEIKKDTVYCIDSVIQKDTIYIITNSTTHKVDTLYVAPEKKVAKNNSSKFSVYGGVGLLAHDILSDPYVTSKYKLSESAFVGVTYKPVERIHINGEFNYTAPSQYLYNAQYIGAAATIGVDVLNYKNNHLVLTSGAEYAHSYNLRTIDIQGNKTTTKINTDNLYIPVKMSYEYDFKDISMGIFVRGRFNSTPKDWANKYFIDGGIQLRYNFKNGR